MQPCPGAPTRSPKAAGREVLKGQGQGQGHGQGFACGSPCCPAIPPVSGCRSGAPVELRCSQVLTFPRFPGCLQLLTPLLREALPWPLPIRGHNCRLPVDTVGAGGVQRDCAPLAFLVPIFPFAFFSALKQVSFLRSPFPQSLASGKRKSTFPGIGGPFWGRVFLRETEMEGIFKSSRVWPPGGRRAEKMALSLGPPRQS